MHHPVKALAQLPQQRQPGLAVVGVSVVNLLALVAARVAALLIAADAHSSRGRGLFGSRRWRVNVPSQDLTLKPGLYVGGYFNAD